MSNYSKEGKVPKETVSTLQVEHHDESSHVQGRGQESCQHEGQENQAPVGWEGKKLEDLF